MMTGSQVQDDLRRLPSTTLAGLALITYKAGFREYSGLKLLIKSRRRWTNL